MNANEMADLLEQVPMARRVGVPEVAAMLRKQDAAIRQLREALIAHQKAGVGNSTDYKTQHAAYMNAHKALAATEEFK